MLSNILIDMYVFINFRDKNNKKGAIVGDTIVKSGRPSDLRGPIIALSETSGLLGSIRWRKRRVFVTCLLLDR